MKFHLGGGGYVPSTMMLEVSALVVVVAKRGFVQRFYEDKTAILEPERLECGEEMFVLEICSEI